MPEKGWAACSHTRLPRARGEGPAWWDGAAPAQPRGSPGTFQPQTEPKDEAGDPTLCWHPAWSRLQPWLGLGWALGSPSSTQAGLEQFHPCRWASLNSHSSRAVKLQFFAIPADQSFSISKARRCCACKEGPEYPEMGTGEPRAPR